MSVLRSSRLALDCQLISCEIRFNNINVASSKEEPKKANISSSHETKWPPEVIKCTKRGVVQYTIWIGGQTIVFLYHSNRKNNPKCMEKFDMPSHNKCNRSRVPRSACKWPPGIFCLRWTWSTSEEHLAFVTNVFKKKVPSTKYELRQRENAVQHSDWLPHTSLRVEEILYSHHLSTTVNVIQMFLVLPN